MLLKEVQQDVKEECADEIKEALFGVYWKDIGRGTSVGLPQWYKERLIASQPMGTSEEGA